MNETLNQDSMSDSQNLNYREHNLDLKLTRDQYSLIEDLLTYIIRHKSKQLKQEWYEKIISFPGNKEEQIKELSKKRKDSECIQLKLQIIEQF